METSESFLSFSLALFAERRSGKEWGRENNDRLIRRTNGKSFFFLSFSLVPFFFFVSKTGGWKKRTNAAKRKKTKKKKPKRSCDDLLCGPTNGAAKGNEKRLLFFLGGGEEYVPNRRKLSIERPLICIRRRRARPSRAERAPKRPPTDERHQIPRTKRHHQ